MGNKKPRTALHTFQKLEFPESFSTSGLSCILPGEMVGAANAAARGRQLKVSSAESEAQLLINQGLIRPNKLSKLLIN